MDPIPEFVEPHMKGQLFYVTDVNAMPQGSLRDILQPQGIRSLLTVPMMNGAQCIGFVGFDSVRHPYDYSEAEENLLNVFANLLSNIRQKKEKDEKLMHQSLVLNHVSDAVVSVDENGYISYVNPAAEKLYGISAAAMTGHLIREVLPTVFPPEISEPFPLYLKKNKFWKGEVIQYHQSGHPLEIELSASLVMDSRGTESGFVGIHHDITDHNRVLNDLKEERRRLSDIITGTRAGTWEWNMQTGETVFNERWAEIMGYTLRELEPVSIQTWIDHAHPEDLKKSNELIEKHIKGEIDYYEIESRMWHKDGHWVWVLDRGKITRWSEDGKPLLMYGTHQDITERMKTRDDLIKALGKAEESSRLKSHFLGNISHEFRTPMNAIIGFLDVLKDIDLEDKDKNNYLSIVQSSGQRLTETISDIMEMSKIDSGMSEIKISRIDIPALMQAVKAEFHASGEEKGLVMEWKSTIEGSLLFQSDPVKLKIILGCLIKNALKFTSFGRIETGVYAENKNVVFYVKDTGIGILTDRQDAVFERFVQGDLSISRGFEGSGLGLSIARAYVEMLGGKIWFTSAPGKGSTFFFSLPVA